MPISLSALSSARWLPWAPLVRPRGRGQQHLLHLGPQGDGRRREVGRQRHDATIDAQLGVEACAQDAAVDVVRTHCGGQDHVEEEEFGLEPVIKSKTFYDINQFKLSKLTISY